MRVTPVPVNSEVLRAGAWYREALETAQRTGMSDHLAALLAMRP